MSDRLVNEPEIDAQEKRRANIRLAVIIGVVALVFYGSMFFFMS